MKKLICLMFVLGVLLSTAGCISEIDTVKDKSIGVFHDVERIVPVPQFLSPYFKSSQSVPLNNIPNADMENWTGTWTNTQLGLISTETSIYSGKTLTGSSTYVPEYSGSVFYQGGTSYKIYGTASSSNALAYDTHGTMAFQTTSAPFTLLHNYISFYDITSTSSTSYLSPSSYTYFLLMDSSGQVLVKRLIATTGYVTSPTVSYTSTTGTFTGDDGRAWKRITIPLSSAYIGSTVKMAVYTEARIWQKPCCPSYSYGTVFTSYIDNFYYSTSDGSEIYALEAPTAQFTYVVDGYDVTVDAGISQTVGTLYQIKWNWGDGTQTTGVTSDHKYNFPGNKQITLTIMDNENLVDTATLVVSVDGTSYYAGPQGSNTTNLPPIAGFSYGLTGMTINVDGSYSKDDGTISLYSWDFDGTKKNGITASHTYANAGSKTVTLIVKDNYGLESERKITFDLPIGGVTTDTNVVDNPGKPPNAKFTYTLIAPTVTVDASESSDDVKIETYEWNWGDGSTSVGKTQTHTYSDMGTTRTITLTVTDDEGFTASSSATVQTISYNEPVDSNATTYVAPPITSGTSTPNPTTTSSNSFPLWGFLVFVGLCALFIGGIALLFGGKKKRPRRLGKKGGKKR